MAVMNLKSIGWMRTLRGVREGDQMILFTGLALVALQWLRDSGQKKELIYRKKVPVGSSVLIRHVHRGAPKITIQKP
ncbi:MAG TPA: hypothetical protein VLB85_13480 [Acidimicrobiia bacterium]|nr:hypothetical protein [Acidimicrobiia bacterium]